ncbi:MAG: hypothetical protein U0796_13290 [Gemmatales bacterium]
MSELTFDLPQLQTKDDASTVSTKIHSPGRVDDIWYRVSSGRVAHGVEAIAAACLVPAMKMGLPLRTPHPVSSRFLAGLQKIQTVLHGWYPVLKPVPLAMSVLPDTTAGNEGRGAASFFSAGVDACYTFLSHQTELTACVLIHGFDYQHDATESRQAVSTMAQNAMKKLGKPLIEVDTNIRNFGDRYVDWGYEYHGSVLASVALLLSPQVHTVYIPSSYTLDTLFPWGSHPETDPLWSSEAVRIVHDGFDTNRCQKTIRISQSDVLLGILRVCWSDFHKTGHAYNCGKCEKCTRTMLDLRIAGALDRCTTFRNQLKLSKLARIDVRHEKVRHFYQASYEEAQKHNVDPQLMKSLEECLSNKHHTGFNGMMSRLRKRLRQDLIRPCMRPFEKAVQRISGRK